jgi:hypothetical protein
MVRGGGSTARLLLESEETLREHLEWLREQQAPAELLESVGSGQALPFFWQHGGNYHPANGAWREQMHPAQTLVGQQTYRWALVPNPQEVLQGVLVSRDEYLTQLRGESTPSTTMLDLRSVGDGT